MKFPDAELRGAVGGQFVKVTGVVTCGSRPLEISFQKLQRCVYVSSELYEHRGCCGRGLANIKHGVFSWGCRHSEKYVADFYISDFQFGLRVLGKSGFVAKVAPFLKPSVVIDVMKDNKESAPNFLRWLSDRGLLNNDHQVRLNEGEILQLYQRRKHSKRHGCGSMPRQHADHCSTYRASFDRLPMVLLPSSYTHRGPRFIVRRSTQQRCHSSITSVSMSL